MYYYRDSLAEYYSARVTRLCRSYLLTRLGTNKDPMLFQGNSRLVDELLSFFPLSVCFGDSLHVIYEGIVENMLQYLKEIHPTLFGNLKTITSNLRCPRQSTSLNYSTDSGSMVGNDKKY